MELKQGKVQFIYSPRNQSIIKEMNFEYLLEGLMLKLKLQYFGHLMWRADSLEQTPMLGKIEGRRRRGWQEQINSVTDSTDMNLSKFQEILEDKGAWHAAVHGIPESDMTEQLTNKSPVGAQIHVDFKKLEKLHCLAFGENLVIFLKGSNNRMAVLFLITGSLYLNLSLHNRRICLIYLETWCFQFYTVYKNKSETRENSKLALAVLCPIPQDDFIKYKGHFMQLRMDPTLQGQSLFLERFALICKKRVQLQGLFSWEGRKVTPIGQNQDSQLL